MLSKIVKVYSHRNVSILNGQNFGPKRPKPKLEKKKTNSRSKYRLLRTCYFYPTRTISSHSFFLNNRSRSKLNSEHVLDCVLCRMMTLV